MPRKRIQSKLRDPLLEHRDAWLVLWIGPSFNKRDPNKPAFSSFEEVRQYWQNNKKRLMKKFSKECWVWHRFEPHDRENCDTCHRHVHDADDRYFDSSYNPLDDL